MSGSDDATRLDPTRFGYTQNEWDQAVDAGVGILKDVAGAGSTIDYTDFCERIFAITGVRVVPGEYALAHLLGDVSRETLSTHNCAITTLVVYKDSTEAGSGLYTLAIEEGLLPKNPTEVQKDQFRISHMNRAYEIWRRQRHVPGERFR
jgi:hypothetical protein